MARCVGSYLLCQQTSLEVSLKQLSGMLEVGDSVGHVDQLLAEAQDFHMMTAVSLHPTPFPLSSYILLLCYLFSSHPFILTYE